MRRRLFRRIGLRIGVILTVTLVLLLGASGWLALRLHRHHLMVMLKRSAVDTGQTILTSMRSSMLANDTTHLREIIDNVGRQEQVLGLRIIDAHGEVRHSTRAEEIATVLGVGTPTCRSCHGVATTHRPTRVEEGLSLYPLSPGKQALGLAVPILNAPDCSTSGCHFHPPEQVVLGVLDLELSTAEIEDDMARAGTQMAVFLGSTVVIACALLGIIVWRMVQVPIRRLTEGTRRLAAVEWGHRIEVDAAGPQDELGELAASFNTMTERLEAAYRELEQWGEKLEEKVASKTRELEAAKDQAVNSEKMASLGKLAAIVAHELNNPLAGLLVYAKVIRRRLPRLMASEGAADESEVAELRETLATMEREISRCGEIVRNLLAFSRRRAATMSLEDPAEIVHRAVSLVRHQADLQEIDVAVEVEPSVPKIVCDAAHVEQAVLAVVINAMEAMPDGGSLTVTLARSPDGSSLQIRIRDTGPGVPDALRDRIFEPFFTTKQDAKGTGLGLAVVYGIVQQHGGSVKVDDAPGGGAIFLIDLPVHAGDGSGVADDPGERAEEVSCHA